MRQLLLLVAAVLAPMAYVQASTVTTSSTTYVEAPVPRQVIGGSMQQSAEPRNCGTPDEPKACPPMPRVPLPYYMGDRGR
jgi:hypothetical protein